MEIQFEILSFHLLNKKRTWKEKEWMEKGRDFEKRTKNFKQSVLKSVILTITGVLLRMPSHGVWVVWKNTGFLSEVRVHR